MTTVQSRVMGLVVNVSPTSAPPHVPRVATLYPAGGMTVNDVDCPDMTLTGALGVTVNACGPAPLTSWGVAGPMWPCAPADGVIVIGIAGASATPRKAVKGAAVASTTGVPVNAPL